MTSSAIRGFSYLASPYTYRSEDAEETRKILAYRYEDARRAIVTLMKEGWAPFSTIVHWHDAELNDPTLPTDFASWVDYNDRFIAGCDAFLVLKIGGWSVSKGVAHEIELARTLGKPMFEVHLDPYEIKPFEV